MTYVAPTAEQRLDRLRAQLSEAGAKTPHGRRIRLNQPANLLVGAALHAAARHGAGKELSDLEQRLITTLTTVMPEDEIEGFGKVFTATEPTVSAEVFPAAIARLSVDDAYTFDDLMADLDTLGPQILALPNTQIINLDDLDTSRGAEAEEFPAVIDSAEYLAAVPEYGPGATFITAGPGPDERGSGPVQAQLKFVGAKCWHDTGESTSDEPYWAYAAGADSGDRIHGKTTEASDVDTGETRYWKREAGVFFNGSVGKHIGFNIELWEADDSFNEFYRQLQKTLSDISDWCYEAANRADEHGSDGGVAWTTLFRGITELISTVIGWIINEDDLVQERSCKINRDGLRALAAKPGQQATIKFAGAGGGDYDLWLRWRGRPMATALVGNDAWIKNGYAMGSWTKLATDAVQMAASHGRVGWVTTDNKIYVRNIDGATVMLTDKGKQLALYGSRIGYVDTDGVAWFKDGWVTTGEWKKLVGNVAQIAVDDYACAVLLTNGEVWVTVSFIPLVKVADNTAQVVLDHGHIGIRKTNGDVFDQVLENGGGWGECEATRAAHLALYGDTMAIIDTGGGLSFRRDGTWAKLPLGDRKVRHVALGRNYLGFQLDEPGSEISVSEFDSGERNSIGGSGATCFLLA